MKREHLSFHIWRNGNNLPLHFEKKAALFFETRNILFSRNKIVSIHYFKKKDIAMGYFMSTYFYKGVYKWIFSTNDIDG
jgi:hypothetical protein